jgi:hypothetical protein
LINTAIGTTNNLTVAIRSSLNGTDLTSATLSADIVPLERGWIDLNVTDIYLNIGQTYYIIFKPEGHSMVYFWWGYDNHNVDSYPEGEAWLYTGGNWVNDGFMIKDFCFKTYGYHESIPPLIPTIPDGPLEGLSWHEYYYETVTTDPDGDDIRYGWDWNGDGFVDEWTGYYSSGTHVTTTHFWIGSGFYSIKVKAEDEYGVSSDFSDVLLVTISNDPPSKPSILSGDTIGVVNQVFLYESESTDHEGNVIRYGWDWDGDMTIDEWTDYYPSGTRINISHFWVLPGTYYMKVVAQDNLSAQSDFSEPYRVIIVDVDNDPPHKPSRPIGNAYGRVDVSYSFGTVTNDPNGDRIYYLFDWDDGSTSGWIGPFSSGQPCNISHSWASKGSFQVKVKARDEVGYESVWSDPLAISMPYLNSFIYERISNYIRVLYNGRLDSIYKISDV